MTDEERRRAVAYGIEAERIRQNKKWGLQDHGPYRWLAILAEEVGEVAADINRAYEDDELLDEPRLAYEITQVAAVAAAWVENIMRDREARRNASMAAKSPDAGQATSAAKTGPDSP